MTLTITLPPATANGIRNLSERSGLKPEAVAVSFLAACEEYAPDAPAGRRAHEIDTVLEVENLRAEAASSY
jgi:hypothetical protein